MDWKDSIKYTVKSVFIDITNMSKTLHHGTINYSDYLQSTHSLYRYVTQTLRVKDSFSAMVIAMNKKSHTPNETQCIISLSRRQLNDWFIEHGGREYSAKEKLLDSP